MQGLLKKIVSINMLASKESEANPYANPNLLFCYRLAYQVAALNRNRRRFQIQQRNGNNTVR
jgi:hypothetical protein